MTKMETTTNTGPRAVLIDGRRRFRPAPRSGAKRRAQHLAWELIDALTAKRLTRKTETLVDQLAEFAMGRAAR